MEFIKREDRRSGGISTKARQRDWARFAVWNKVSSGLNLVILATEYLLLEAWPLILGGAGDSMVKALRTF